MSKILVVGDTHISLKKILVMENKIQQSLEVLEMKSTLPDVLDPSDDPIEIPKRKKTWTKKRYWEK